MHPTRRLQVSLRRALRRAVDVGALRQRQLPLLSHEIRQRQRAEVVTPLAQLAQELALELRLRFFPAPVADDHRHLALLVAAHVLSLVQRVVIFAHAAVRILARVCRLRVHHLVGLFLGFLLAPQVEQVVSTFPVSPLRKRLQVPVDPAPHVVDALRLQLVLGSLHLRQQRGGSFAPNAARAVHHHLLALELLLGLRGVEPLGKLAAVSHHRVEELGATLRGFYAADARLVIVANVDDDGVLVAEHLVVLVSLEVLGGVLLEQRGALAAEAVRDELLGVFERQGLELGLRGHAVGELEVGVVEKVGVPIPQALAEPPGARGRRGEGAVDALQRDATAASDVVLARQAVELRDGLLLPARRPHGLHVLVEEDLRDALGGGGRRQGLVRHGPGARLHDLLALRVAAHRATRAVREGAVECVRARWGASGSVGGAVHDELFRGFSSISSPRRPGRHASLIRARGAWGREARRTRPRRRGSSRASPPSRSSPSSSARGSAPSPSRARRWTRRTRRRVVRVRAWADRDPRSSTAASTRPT